MFEPGRDFLGYRIISELGRGGMGRVLVGFCRQSSTFAALKTLYPEFLRDQSLVSRFRREADIYSSLNHPNIVRLVREERDPANPVIILEYVRGAPLHKVIKRAKGPLPLPLLVKIVEESSHALFHAHAKGVVHRDIKPMNIMLDPEGTVKILDFGIAHLEDFRLNTDVGTMMGTCAYASPEQNAGDPTDERSDLYSLGLVAWELITGKRALQGKSPLDIARRQIAEALPLLTDVSPDTPLPFAQLVDKLVQREADKRFQSARALVDAFIELRMDLPRQYREMLFGGEDAKLIEDLKRSFHAKNYARALELVEELEASGKDSSMVHFLKGKVYAARRVPYLSSEAFEKALELDATNLEYRLEYALVLHALEWYDRALKQVETILTSHPKHPLALGLKAILQEEEQKRRSVSG